MNSISRATHLQVSQVCSIAEGTLCDNVHSWSIINKFDTSYCKNDYLLMNLKSINSGLGLNFDWRALNISIIGL